MFLFASSAGKTLLLNLWILRESRRCEFRHSSLKLSSVRSFLVLQDRICRPTMEIFNTTELRLFMFDDIKHFEHCYFLKFCPEVPEFSDNLSTSCYLSTCCWCLEVTQSERRCPSGPQEPRQRWNSAPDAPMNRTHSDTTGKLDLFRLKAQPCSHLVTVAIRHWFPGFRDDVLGSLQETRRLQLFLLAPPPCIHNQLGLVERVRSAGVRGDRLNDDAVAGAEAVRLRRANKPKWRRQTNK